DANGNAIPEVTNTGTDTLDITPYADNTPRGWAIETYFNEGDPVADGDLLIVGGVAGVSENTVVQPSASQDGQVFVTNAATGTPIAVFNYVLNTNIVVNGNDGTAGDTDSLTLRGADPATPGASGNDGFDIDLTRTGAAGDEFVRVIDRANGDPLYNVQSFTNFGTLYVQMLGGSDTATVVGATNGIVGINIDGGPDALFDTVTLPGVADGSVFFSVTYVAGGSAISVLAARLGLRITL